ERSAEGSGPQTAMTAAVARGVRGYRIALRRNFLRQSRQGVVLGQNADDRLARAEFGDKGGRHVRHADANLEAGRFEFFDQERRGAAFLESYFRKLPDRFVDFV